MNVIVCAKDEFDEFREVGAPKQSTNAIAIGPDWVKAVHFGTDEGAAILNECRTVVADRQKLWPIIKLAHKLRSGNGNVSIFVHPGNNPSPTDEMVRESLGVSRSEQKLGDDAENSQSRDEEWTWFRENAVGFSHGGNDPDYKVPEISLILDQLRINEPEDWPTEVFDGQKQLPGYYEKFRLRDRAAQLVPLVIALYALVSSNMKPQKIYPDLIVLIAMVENDFARQLGRELLDALKSIKRFAELAEEKVPSDMKSLIAKVTPKLRRPVEKVLFRTGGT